MNRPKKVFQLRKTATAKPSSSRGERPPASDDRPFDDPLNPNNSEVHNESAVPGGIANNSRLSQSALQREPALNGKNTNYEGMKNSKLSEPPSILNKLLPHPELCIDALELHF